MKIELARESLHQHLHPYFEYKKYLEKSPLVFERKTSFGSSAFTASISGDSEIGYVNFFAGIRHDLVELALRNTFGLQEYFEGTSYTLLINLKNVDRQRVVASLPFKKVSEIETIGDLAIEIMDDVGFDFLNHYKSLENLDRLFNDSPTTLSKWTNHSYYHRFRAMAIANLRLREDYDKLFSSHREYLKKRGFTGPILAKFDSTFAHLKTLSFN